MSEPLEQRVPDLGDFHDVEVIEVLVKPGDRVERDAPLITLETDKATMDVPATAAGVVQEVKVGKGDRVSKGSLIALLAGDRRRHRERFPRSARRSCWRSPPARPRPAAGCRPRRRRDEPAADLQAQLLVIGAGPGGYTAAFRAADLGLSVTLVDRWPQLGGVCLNVGCIPSKALLHAARVIEEAESMAAHGIRFQAPEIDAAALQAMEEPDRRQADRRPHDPRQAAQGERDPRHRPLRLGASRRDRGRGRQPAGDRLRAMHHRRRLRARAHPGPAGRPARRRLDRRARPRRHPEAFLVIGGGIIGLEMACVYDALGSEVSVVELTDALMPGCDRDLVRPLEKRLRARYAAILHGHEGHRRRGGQRRPHGHVRGRRTRRDRRSTTACCARSGACRTGARSAPGPPASPSTTAATSRSTGRCAPTCPHIFAIGDIVGQPMLAHKATHEGKVAAEVAAGQKSAFDARVIPSVAYTDPEIAWVGVTEAEAQAAGRKLGKGLFPWMASGRSLALNREEGFTKLLFDPDTHRVVGGGIVGTERGRPHLGGRARDRDGRDGGRRRAHRAPAPDAVRDGGLRGGSFRRHAHRPLHPEEDSRRPAAVLCGHRQMSRIGHCGHLGLRATQT